MRSIHSPMLWNQPTKWLLHPRQHLHPLRKYSTRTLLEPQAKQVPAFPEFRNPHHSDLPSFLKYADRIGLDTSSTVYVGTHYEYTVQNTLEQLGMSLTRIGRANDCGIDLIGTWALKPAIFPLKVIVQCKASQTASPSIARELEGAFVGAPSGWKDPGVLGFLVSQAPASKGVRDALNRSRLPMVYARCDAEGKMLQMFWNRKAAEEGLEGVRTVAKYAGGERDSREVILTWKGEMI